MLLLLQFLRYRDTVCGIICATRLATKHWKRNFEFLPQIFLEPSVKWELRKTKTEITAFEFFLKKPKNCRNSWTKSRNDLKIWLYRFFGARNRLVTLSPTSDKQECQIPGQGCQVLNFFRFAKMGTVVKISKLTFFCNFSIYLP